MSKALMFLGTGSDVGKSISVTAFCRLFRRRGYKVTPFKAQNMSNNSYVTIEGGEIGRAQVAQAEAAGVLPSVHMNPILLKPSTGMGSQIVLHGKVFGEMDVVDYYAIKPRLKKAVMTSYQRLASDYDIIVMEGAGSCCEMNLKDNDLVNLPLAKQVKAPCILVADIDKGGVFAQIIGTYNLMTRKEKELTIGFLINKFRGDPLLFSEGIEYIEKKTGKPVLGLVPIFHDIPIDSEDSVSVQEDKRPPKSIGPKTVNIAVLRLPAISNFTDLEVLELEKDVVVNYVFRPKELNNDYDCMIIPGTKNAMQDAVWLSRMGWRKTIEQFSRKGKRVLGICGGYQLMGERVKDPYGVESDRLEVSGLDLLPVTTTLEKEKIVRKVVGTCLTNGKRVQGYEIHMGRSRVLKEVGEPFMRIGEEGEKERWQDGWSLYDGLISGTYVHGLFDMPGFRGDFLNRIRKAKGLKVKRPKQGRVTKDHLYDRLANHFETHCDVEKILSSVLNA